MIKRRVSARLQAICLNSVMLKILTIENIAVIEKAEIDFEKGFCVLSGETGAGKSIIVDSLNAVLGMRVSRELIRTGASFSSVTALFDDLPPRIKEKLCQQGLVPQNGSIEIKREMYPDGRNSCRINGRQVSLSLLRELAPGLVDIYGQHDGRSLMDESQHIDYLDSYAGLEQELESFGEKYDELLKLNRTIKSMSMSREQRLRRQAALDEGIAELESLGLKEGEYDALNEERTSLIRKKSAGEALRESLMDISGDEENLGGFSLVGQCVKRLEKCPGLEDCAPGVLSIAKEAQDILQDLLSGLSDGVYRLDFSYERFDAVENRLDDIITLSEKHKVKPDELPKLLDDMKAELKTLGGDENIDSLKALYAEKRGEVFRMARDLTEKRRAAAVSLSERVCLELAQLDMPAAQMAVDIESQSGIQKVRFTRKGIDTVQFLLSANRGESLRPLNKVASGGELSRIMLALKTVLSLKEPEGTAVFDEIDTGVSGRAADKVGRKLYQISRSRQVLCITHLPQIAALADCHFRIVKTEEEGRTFTHVQKLDTEGRKEELSRLMSGMNVTKTSMESAGEMLKAASEFKSLTK